MEAVQQDDGILSTIKYYLMDFTYALHIKAVLAAIVTVFVDILGGTVEVFYGYLFFATLDLVLGMVKSIVYKNFDRHKINQWMVKMTVQFLTAGTIALFFYMFHKTSGVMISVVNWIFLIYSLSDLSSILDKIEQMGFKLPIPAKLLVKFLRRRTSRQLATLFDDPDAAQEIENALAAKNNKKTPNEG